MDIFKILEEKAKAVERELEPYLPLKEPKELYALMREYPMRGGKRLRPAFCMLSCEAFGGEAERAAKTATALEVFQNWALIHDDIEDDSEMRRGKPCLHKIYGVPLALNAGDGLHVKMWEMLFDNKDTLGYEISFRILDEFRRLSMETVEGQAIEINWVSSRTYELTEEDYYRMAGKKTSWYTVITPFRTGAIIAGANERLVDSLIDFGWKLGIAFQIQDDLLNLVGKEEKYGKEIAGDIAEGKRSLMLIKLLSSCNKEEKKKVTAILSKDRLAKSKREIDFVLGLMERYGTIEFGKRRAKEFASESRAVLNQQLAPNFKSVSAGKTISELVDFVINREF